jgi:uncharacterized protein (DUF362 family)
LPVFTCSMLIRPRTNEKGQGITRREFLGKSALGTAGAVAAWQTGTWQASADLATKGRVALIRGFGRAENAFRAMQVFKKEIATAIGNKRVIIKPNGVSETTPLADTHADWLEGILEFLKSIGKTDVTIAESNAAGATLRVFYLMDYFKLTSRYPVKLVDLNQEGYELRDIWKNDSTLWTIRVSKVYLDPNNFIISCPRMKTHNTVVVTASLKNVVMSAPIVDVGCYGPGENLFTKPGRTFQPGARSNKWGAAGWPGMHGAESSAQILNDNIYRMVKIHGICPDLSVIDGYEGMQGDGPVGGSAVPVQNLGVAAFDFLAADRVCVRLMGHEGYLLDANQPALGPYPACLNYLAQSGLGTWDINRIVDAQSGAPITNAISPSWIVNYKPSPSLATQLGMRAAPKE